METFSTLLAICAGNSPVNSTHKGQWRGALRFSLICAWMNGWVNNCEVGDLRRHRIHYDVTIMYRLSVLSYTKSIIQYVSNGELKALYFWLDNTVGCIKHVMLGKWGKHILTLLSQVMNICECVCLSMNWVFIGLEGGGSLCCEHQAHYLNSLTYQHWVIWHSHKRSFSGNTNDIIL